MAYGQNACSWDALKTSENEWGFPFEFAIFQKLAFYGVTLDLFPLFTVPACIVRSIMLLLL